MEKPSIEAVCQAFSAIYSAIDFVAAEESLQDSIHDVDGFTFPLIRDAVIDIRCGVYRSMPQAFADVVDSQAVLDEHRRMGVPEGMEAQTAEGFTAPQVEILHVVACQRPAVGLCADEVFSRLLQVVRPIGKTVLCLPKFLRFKFGF